MSGLPSGFVLDAPPPTAAPAPQAAGLPDGFVMDAPPAQPSLLGRVIANAKEAFQGTTTGQAVNQYQAGAPQLQIAGDAQKAIDQSRAAGTGAGGASLGTDPRTGLAQPSPYEGLDIPTLEGIVSQTQDTGGAKAADFYAGERKREADYAAMPSFTTEPTVGGKLAGGVAALLGQLGGGLPAVENLVGAEGAPIARQAGESLGGLIARRAVEGGLPVATAQVATDPIVQGQRIALGQQADYDPSQIPEKAALGFGIGAATHLTIGGIHDLIDAFLARRGLTQTPENVQAIQADPEFHDTLRQAGATDDQIAAMSPDFQQTAADRITARQAQDAERATQPPNAAPSEADIDRQRAAKATLAETQEALPTAAPEEAPALQSQAAAAQAELPPAREPLPDVIQQGVQREAPTGETLTEVPGKAVDPGTQVGFDVNGGLTRDQKIQLLDRYDFIPDTLEQQRKLYRAYQDEQTRQSGTDAQGTLRVSDTSGDGVTSPASPPNTEGLTGIKPTDAEIAANPDMPYAQPASGTSDRPFRADDTAGATPEQSAQFEQTARDTADTARQASVDDLERQWKERAQAREGQGSRFSDAEGQYQSQRAKGTFSNRPAPQDVDGRFPVDQYGFVASTKGGPVKFGDQKMAARWIVSQGHKLSPDQIFEIENHPSGEGYTVRERGRSEPPPGGKEEAATASAQQDATGAQRALPAPRDETAPRGEGDGTEGQQGDGSAGAGEQRSAPAEVDDSGRVEGAGAQGAGAEQPDGDASLGSGPDEQSAAGSSGDRAPGLDPTEGARDSSAGGDGSGRNDPSAERAEGDAGVSDQSGAGHGASSETGRRSDLGRTLYSNPFADPKAWRALGDAAMETAGWAGKQAGRFVDTLKGAGQTLKEHLLGSTAIDNVMRVRKAVYDTWFTSKAGQLWSLYTRTGSDAIRQLHDGLFESPGGDRAVGRTFAERKDGLANSWASRVTRSMEDGGIKKDGGVQLGKYIRAGSRGNAVFDKAADTIRGVLKEIRDAAVKAGIEVGDAGRNYLPRVLDNEKVNADTEGFLKAATKAFMRDGMGAREAREAAEAWQSREAMGDIGVRLQDNDFVRIEGSGVKSNATKGRKLSDAAAAEISKAGFYMENPAQILPAYAKRMARQIAWSDMMGPNLEKWHDIKASIIADGAGEHLPDIVDLVSKAAGLQAPYGPRGTGTLSALRTLSALTYLTNAPFLHVGQGTLVGARTGNIMNSFRTYAHIAQQLVGKAKDDVTLAENLGIVERHMHDLITEMTGASSQTVAKFSTATGMDPLVKAFRVASMKITVPYMRQLAAEYGNDATRASATRFLRDSGIPDAEMPAFTKWIAGKADGVSWEDFRKGDRNSDLLSLAMTRMANQVTMKPTAAMRPTYAEHPLGSLIYGITSYAQAFQKLAINRSLTMAKAALTDGEMTLRDRANSLAPAAIMATVVAPVTYALWQLRNQVFSTAPQKNVPTSGLSLAQQIVEHGGLAGNSEAPYAILKSLISGKPILGPELSGLANLGEAAGGLAKNPTSMMTQKHAADGVYRSIVYPMAAAALVNTPLPWPIKFGALVGGKLPGVMGAVEQAFGIRQPPRQGSNGAAQSLR